jgi:hypothetical protein
MGMGPILLFDKSTLQSLSVDESVWFDALYYPNMTPLFFVETLADLEKGVGRRRTPEEVVGNLAEKTPTGGHINVYHETICVNELLGRDQVEMRGVPIVAGGRPVRAQGRRGMVFDESPERRALRRWEERKFLEVERQFARSWRQGLSGLNLQGLYRDGRTIIERLGRPKDLPAACNMAKALLEKPGSRYAHGVLESFRVPNGIRRAIVGRWRGLGGPSIRKYAPYTAHVATVDLFFCIALGADLISRDRPSNKIDIAYLYYLPFSMGFTSSDKLHARTAPLFMDPDEQVFVPGAELKADLATLDAHYSTLSDEVKARGVMSFAHYPPTDGDYLVSRLWDKLMAPGWRENATKPQKPRSRETDERLIEQMRAVEEAPSTAKDFDPADADAVIFTRMVPLRRGKWRLLPPEVEKAGQEREKNASS